MLFSIFSNNLCMQSRGDKHDMENNNTALTLLCVLIAPENTTTFVSLTAQSTELWKTGNSLYYQFIQHHFLKCFDFSTTLSV